MDIAPMALGALTDGISVEQMAAAYGAFANDGYYNKPITYTKVVDAGGM
jgi:penicillin-binding protein 1A